MANTEEPSGVVVHLDEADPDKQQGVLRNVGNLLDEMGPDLRVELVVHGPGISVCLNDSPLTPTVNALIGRIGDRRRLREHDAHETHRTRPVGRRRDHRGLQGPELSTPRSCGPPKRPTTSTTAPPFEQVAIHPAHNQTGGYAAPVLNDAPHPDTAGAFVDYMSGPAGQHCYQRYGFDVPAPIETTSRTGNLR